MGKTPDRPGKLRRVGGVALMSAGIGMILAFILPGFSVFLGLVLLAFGFYFLFM